MFLLPGVTSPGPQSQDVFPGPSLPPSSCGVAPLRTETPVIAKYNLRVLFYRSARIWPGRANLILIWYNQMNIKQLSCLVTVVGG